MLLGAAKSRRKNSDCVMGNPATILLPRRRIAPVPASGVAAAMSHSSATVYAAWLLLIG